ncbi:MAG: C4-type zinc ribbon domain-containing protein [Clostridia bacterium]|nr:C4-type zinc ribbon domain-containing protein [Clostridia bacterium]
MDIKKILDYQTKDFEIIKLERTLNESADKKILDNLVELVKESQNTSAMLEKEAEETLLQYNNMKKNYEDNIKTYETLNRKEVDKLTENEINDIMKLANNISTNLNILEKKLLQQADKINAILADFDNTKKRYNIAREKHKIHKEKFNTQLETIQPQINALAQELKEMEKSIEPKVLNRYKAKRQDKLFPIFVAVNSNSCGGCMMELPSGQIEKLKKDGFLECENCNRIIYFV